MTGNIWADPFSFVSSPPQADAVLRRLDLPRVDHYVDAVSRQSGVKLDYLKRLAASTPVVRSGEDHLKIRRVIAPYFSKKGLAVWDGMIAAAVEQAAERLAQSSRPDLVADFVIPLFLGTIPRLLGLDCERAAEHFEAIETVQRITEPYLSMSALKKLDSAVCEVVGLMHQRPAAGGGDDPEPLLDFLYRRREDLPDDLEPEYLIIGILAGAYSGPQSVAFALHGLLSEPGEVWKAVAEPGWLERELPRLLSLYQTTTTLVRTANEEKEVAGCPYAKGQSVVVDIVGANTRLREEANPARLHMSFGSGAHKCPGSTLTEMLYAHALPTLARRFPRLQLEKERCTFMRTLMLQAPTSLPCTLAEGSRRLSSRLLDVRDMELGRRVVREDGAFSPPQMVDHLTTLAEQSGRDLSTAIRIARNAMFFMDGARHRALRDHMSAQLSASRLEAWEGYIDDAVAVALDDLGRARTPDLVTGFADRMRRDVVARILGVEAVDGDRFEEIAPRLQDVLEPWLSLKDLEQVQATFAEALDLMRGPSGAQRPQSLLGALLVDRLDGFDDEDLKAVVLVLYGASFNLSHTLANILYRILTRPAEDHREAGADAWIGERLEELIALCGGPKYIYRMARHDLDLAAEPGRLAMKRGDTARIDIQAVNRQRENGAGHLSFGHGLHRCVGSAISRLVIRRAVPALFSRYPDIALVKQAQTYFSLSQTVALQALPCMFNSVETKKHDVEHRNAIV